MMVGKTKTTLVEKDALKLENQPRNHPTNKNTIAVFRRLRRMAVSQYQAITGSKSSYHASALRAIPQ